MVGLATERHESSKSPIDYRGFANDVDVEMLTYKSAGANGIPSQGSHHSATLHGSGVSKRMLDICAAPKQERKAMEKSFDILTCTSFFEMDKQKDAWKMREEFFGLKRNTAALYDFLDKWGVWEMSSVWLLGNARPSMSFGNAVPYYVIPEKVWEQRDYYRSALKASPDKWLSYAEGMRAVLEGKRQMTPSTEEWLNRPEALIRTVSTRESYPHFQLRRSLCRQTIEATITMDFLRKTKFGICKRTDCSKPYPIESLHKRKFCSQYCGHLESMRRQSRERNKQSRKQNSRKK